MKVIFFDKVIFEGNNEECQMFKRNFLDNLHKLADELNDTSNDDTRTCLTKSLRTCPLGVQQFRNAA